jgi:hypothetical protein
MNHVVSAWGSLVAAAVMSVIAATDSSAQTAARDGEGTALRAPSAAEAKALAPAAASAERRVGMVTGKVNPAAIVHSDGTVEQELDASTMSYTVARANADGSISMVCVTGEHAAQKAMTGKASRAKLAVAKGHSHDAK